jgi:hypothetical protein
VLGQLTGEDEADRSLDLSGRDGGLLVVSSQLASLSGDALEDIVDEGVEDRHGTVGDTGVGVDLLQDLVDVRRVSLLASLGALLLLASGGGLLAGILLLGSLGSGSRGLGGGLLVSGLGRHVEVGGLGGWEKSEVCELSKRFGLRIQKAVAGLLCC